MAAAPRDGDYKWTQLPLVPVTAGGIIAMKMMIHVTLSHRGAGEGQTSYPYVGLSPRNLLGLDLSPGNLLGLAVSH